MILSEEKIIHLSASICEIFEEGLDQESHLRSSLVDFSKHQLYSIEEEEIKQAIIRAMPDLIRSIQSAIEEVELTK
jgi:hypothetical protein